MNEHDQDEDLQLPAKLAEALRDLQKERVFVPQEVDAKILADAREHLKDKRGRIVSLPKWMALAAAFILLCGVAFVLLQQRSPVPQFAAEDINHDGEVNILDALALARKVESGESVQADFNSDGLIDQQDVDAIAADSVKLEKGGAS